MLAKLDKSVQQSVAMARMTLALMRSTQAAWFPGVPFGEAVELRYIAIQIYIAHAEGKRLTMAKLARATGMPRATLIRKVAALAELGYVERRGRFLYSAPGANLPTFQEVIDRDVHLVMATAEELAKMSTP